jgi:hypothetical protein
VASTEDARRGPAPLALRYADVLVLAAALPVFIAAGLPLLGYGVIAVAWLAQHAVLAYAEGRAREALGRGDRRSALGAVGISTFARLWLVTATILAVGLIAEREDGLAAAILAVVLVTFHLGAVAVARIAYPREGTG